MREFNMEGFKKIGASLIGAFMFLNNFTVINAMHYSYEDEMRSVQNSSDVVYENIMINEGNGYSDNSFQVEDVENCCGEIVYNIEGVDGVQVEFLHKLGVVAHEDKGKEMFVLGLSGAKPKTVPVKYLPNNDKYGAYKDSCYIVRGGKYYKLDFSDSSYCFKKMDDEAETEIKRFSKDFVDYGVQIYVSEDGKIFEKCIEKNSRINNIDKNARKIGASGDLATDRYVHTIELSELGGKYRYIKIQINEVVGLGCAMTDILKIRFNIDDDLKKQDTKIEQSEQIKQRAMLEKLLLERKQQQFGASKSSVRSGDKYQDQYYYWYLQNKDKVAEYERNKDKIDKYNKMKKKFSYANNRYKNDWYDDYKRKSADKNKDDYLSKYKDGLLNTYGSYNSDSDNGKLDDYRNSYKENKSKNRSSTFVNVDEYEDEGFGNKGKISSKEVGNQKKRNVLTITDNDNFEDITGVDDFVNFDEGRGVADQDSCELGEMKQENKNAQEKNEQMTTQELFEKKQEENQQDKQERAEKTVSKVYLSGLFVTLASVLGYDKLGFLRKIIKI